jgi:hypothetical protein
MKNLLAESFSSASPLDARLELVVTQDFNKTRKLTIPMKKLSVFAIQQ